MDRPLAAVVKDGNRIVALRTASADEYAGKVFIDASYEGDLMAQAGVKYHVGREGRSVYREPLAGVQDHSPAHQWPVRVNALMDGKPLPFVGPGPLEPPGTRRPQSPGIQLPTLHDTNRDGPRALAQTGEL